MAKRVRKRTFKDDCEVKEKALRKRQESQGMDLCAATVDAGTLQGVRGRLRERFKQKAENKKKEDRSAVEEQEKEIKEEGGGKIRQEASLLCIHS